MWEKLPGLVVLLDDQVTKKRKKNYFFLKVLQETLQCPKNNLDLRMKTEPVPVGTDYIYCMYTVQYCMVRVYVWFLGQICTSKRMCVQKPVINTVGIVAPLYMRRVGFLLGMQI